MSASEILLTVDYEGGDRGLPSASDARVLPEVTDNLLAFLDQRRAKATFFVVAAVAEAFPDLVRRIAGEGHEIGLHSYRHQRPAELGREAFADDLRRGVEALQGLGLPEPVCGFRAPFFSLTRETAWVFDVLSEQGFVYDSSMLPVWNPVTGSWAGGSWQVHRLENGLWSVPVAVVNFSRHLGVQVGGGLYLRLLPMRFQRWGLARYAKANEPACLYLHPYELDPRSSIGDVFGGNLMLNALLGLRRGDTLARLGRLIEGHSTARVIDHLRRREAAAASKESA